jgi:hypothetical protein
MTLDELLDEAKRRGCIRVDFTIALVGDRHSEGRRPWCAFGANVNGPIRWYRGRTPEQAVQQMVREMSCTEMPS